MTIGVKEIQWGQDKLRLETGRIARQADASVLVDMNGTTLLVTVVAAKEPKEGANFFPLTVNYQERAYATGKVPGGFFKREGKPSEREVLISRLIDRALRPLFPKGYYNEVQVIACAVSINPEVDTEVPAMIGASAAITLAGLPFAGPVGAARVGYVDGEYVLNPHVSTLAKSSLELSVAGTRSSVLMVESEASELSEDVMLGAVKFGHDAWVQVIDAISEMAAEHGKPAVEWHAPVTDEVKQQQILSTCKDKIEAAYNIQEKQSRSSELKIVRDTVVEELCQAEDSEYTKEEVLKAISGYESRTVRQRILAGQPRIDGRDTKTVRNIDVEVGVLGRTHGSALFTRGETQALVVATLGSAKDAQIVETPSGETKDNFMLHYNFPPYCVGECGMMFGPKRREIGHGRLAKRGVAAMIPAIEDFPYTLRVVSEVTESYGSSSMASLCGASLALMDAGVPMKAPVAGIAMGLIKEGEDIVVLTDILGDEDHLGDMDFKVAGSSEGITALQMDIKIQGITHSIMETALAQAKDARLHILGIMNKTINKSRDNLSEHAPAMLNMQINPDKIRDVIGKGGATIKGLTEAHSVSIDITDDGLITICAANQTVAETVKVEIETITAEAEVGKIYKGKVVRLLDFGAFVTIIPGKDGLLHISQIKKERVEKVSDELEVGQEVSVKVLEIDKQGRVKLSMLLGDE